MGKMLITTTSNISDPNIREYIGPVSSHIVLGTNLFSDFTASITDIFGGTSGTYSDKLKIIYRHIIENINKEAAYIGADAIVGLKIDFSEISGKGKGMLMASAIGTAVKLKKNNSGVNFDKCVPIDLVADRLSVENIFHKLQNDMQSITESEWDKITHSHAFEYDKLVISQLCNYENSSSVDKNIINFLKMGNFEKICEVLYDSLTAKNTSLDNKFACSRPLALKIIRSGNFFNPKIVYSILEKCNLKIIVKLIDADKDIYDKEDLQYMDKIANYLNNLPDKGQVIEEKTLLGKTKQVYKCQNGHKNNISDKFCTDIGCGENIKGLTCDEEEGIGKFNSKIKIIRDIMNIE